MRNYHWSLRRRAIVQARNTIHLKGTLKIHYALPLLEFWCARKTSPQASNSVSHNVATLSQKKLHKATNKIPGTGKKNCKKQLGFAEHRQWRLETLLQKSPGTQVIYKYLYKYHKEIRGSHVEHHYVATCEDGLEGWMGEHFLDPNRKLQFEYCFFFKCQCPLEG